MMLPFHPAPRALEQFVDGDAVPRRVTAHLADCPHCRDAVQFHRELRAALHALPAPRTSDAALARILASRADGERVILPAAEPKRRTMTPARVAATAIAMIGGAALLALALRATRVSDDLFVSSAFLPASAHAQTVTRGPAVPPIAPIDGTRLKPLTMSYESRWVDSKGRTTPDGDGQLVVSRDSVNGVLAWRLTHQQRSHAKDGQLRTETETLFVQRSDLRPIARAVHVTPYLRFRQINLWQRFTGDSLTGEMTADGGIRRAFTRRLDAAWAPYITDSDSPIILGAVHLGDNWRGGGALLGWAVRNDDVFRPLKLRVVGSETVATPAGRVDCWKLMVDAGEGETQYWVRKSDGVGVRVLGAVTSDPRGAREIIVTIR